jgi:hypothetical protein
MLNATYETIPDVPNDSELTRLLPGKFSDSPFSSSSSSVVNVKFYRSLAFFTGILITMLMLSCFVITAKAPPLTVEAPGQLDGLGPDPWRDWDPYSNSNRDTGTGIGTDRDRDIDRELTHPALPSPVMPLSSLRSESPMVVVPLPMHCSDCTIEQCVLNAMLCGKTVWNVSSGWQTDSEHRMICTEGSDRFKCSDADADGDAKPAKHTKHTNRMMVTTGCHSCCDLSSCWGSAAPGGLRAGLRLPRST